jgi:predicted anti-sigma-YlaC factor YlaD
VLTCRDMSELATNYLDGQLGFVRRFGVWKHLRACSACRRFYDQMRRTVALLARLPYAPPPAETEERIIAALRRPPGGPPDEPEERPPDS